MCGICGVLDYSLSQPEHHKIRSMVASIQHRGPDYSNVHVSGPVGLGHARLSIIDLSERGNQPMHSHDGRYTIVYNGELYNFQEIRKRLEREGSFTFKSTTDTEVILQAFICWGKEALNLFNGMFSFAIWDEQDKALFIARDYYGIKPLYYSFIKKGIVFGSEIKALLASGRIEPKFNLSNFHEFLYYGVTLGEKTSFDGIFKLLPGHMLIFNRNGHEIINYSNRYKIQSNQDSEAVCIDKVRNLLDKSVESHLISDVPVGVFLSGGIDSSAITALASKHYQGRIRTFSARFDYTDDSTDVDNAKIVSKRFETDHNELYISGNDVTGTIEKLIEAHDEPFSDAANIPLYLLCRELKGAIKVVLQGDGGDEVFAGYRRYNVFSCEKYWRILARMITGSGISLPRKPVFDRYMRFMYAMSRPDAALRMALMLTEESPRRSPLRVLGRELKNTVAQQTPFVRYYEMYDYFKALDPVQRMLNVDCNIILPDVFLEKVDKSTMAHGIEVRVPMMDRPLAAYVTSLPSSYKVRRGQKKWLIRKAMRGIVPDKILDSPKKGFSVPYSRWIRGPLAEYTRSVLLDRSILDARIFDNVTLLSCLDNHKSGNENNGLLLYKLLNFCLWFKKYAPVIG